MRRRRSRSTRMIQTALPLDSTGGQPRAVAETLDLAAVLLVLQAGLGLVAAAGVIFLTVLAAGSPLYLLASLAALIGPTAALLLARGLSRSRRWARNGTILYEAFILISAGVRLFFDRAVALGLVVTLTSIVLPLAVCVLILKRDARRAIAANRGQPSTPVPLPTHHEIRPAA